MNRIEPFIARLLRVGTILATLCLIGTVLLQIFARFFLAQAPSWTEEASRLCFLYAISFAAGLAMKDQYYVYWDLLYQKLGKNAQRVMDLLIPSLVLLMFVLMMLYAVSFMSIGLTETSPGMGMNMAIAFGSMFILSAGLSFYTLLEIKHGRKASNS